MKFIDQYSIIEFEPIFDTCPLSFKIDLVSYSFSDDYKKSKSVKNKPITNEFYADEYVKVKITFKGKQEKSYFEEFYSDGDEGVFIPSINNEFLFNESEKVIELNGEVLPYAGRFVFKSFYPLVFYFQGCDNSFSAIKVTSSQFCENLDEVEKVSVIADRWSFVIKYKPISIVVFNLNRDYDYILCYFGKLSYKDVFFFESFYNWIKIYYRENGVMKSMELEV